MFWNDEDDHYTQTNHTSVVDVVYQLQGSSLPVDYQSAIADALYETVSWWSEQNDIGFYLVLAGEEGNGWYQETNPHGEIYLSRRCRLVIRTPITLLDRVLSLSGLNIVVKQHNITVQHKHNRVLKYSSTLYARHVVSHVDELQFLQTVNQQLAALDITCKKMLCGKSRQLNTADGKLHTRSLMLNDLNKEDSLRLQQCGLGEFQKFGCGVFVPYKSIS